MLWTCRTYLRGAKGGTTGRSMESGVPNRNIANFQKVGLFLYGLCVDPDYSGPRAGPGGRVRLFSPYMCVSPLVKREERIRRGFCGVRCTEHPLHVGEYVFSV